MGQYEVYIAEYVLDGISILCSLVTIGIVVWVWKIYPDSKESPSFNLTLWIAVADIPARISDIFSIPLNYSDGFPQSRVFARFFIWLNFFSSFWFIYLTSMIVLDLQLIFFHRLPRQARIRRWYPLLGSLFAFLLGIPYLCFPNVRLGYNGTMMVGNAKSAAAKVFVLWGQIWLHAGIIYSIIMVIAVCVKIYLAQSQLRRFGGSKLNESVSRSLIRNTYLIIAYPVVLFIVYIPYLLHSLFLAHVPGIFTYRWGMFTFTIFAMQGIFSFAIVLFHPVMLAIYRQRSIGLSSLWSRLFLQFRSSPNDKQSDSGTLLHSQFSTTGNLSTEKPVADIQTCPPQVKTMDMGPGVTGFFNDALGNDGTLSSTAGKYPHEIQGVTVLRMGDCTVNESALEPRNLFIEATTL